MKIAVFVAAVLLLAASAQATTFTECAAANNLSKFVTFFSAYPEAKTALDTLTGTLFAFDNTVDPVAATNGFQQSAIDATAKYIIGQPTATLDDLLKLPKFASQLSGTLFVKLGGANLHLVITNYNGQAFLNGYAAIKNTAPIKCDDTRFLYIVSSFVFAPDVTSMVLGNNVATYKVQKFLDALKSNNLVSSVDGQLTTTVAINDAAFDKAGSLSGGQLSNLIFNELIFSKSVPTEGKTYKAINGNLVTFKRAGDLLQISLNGQTASVVSYFFDLPTRNGVTHIVDTALTTNSAPSSSFSLSMVVALIAAVAAFTVL